MLHTTRSWYCGLLLFSFSLVWAYQSGLTDQLLTKIERRFGIPARARLEAWEKLIAENKSRTEIEKVHLVNSFFNQLRFESDQDQWDKTDYWATPIELLSRGAGDCEDFSIAKYFTLKALGVKEDHLRITYVKALYINQAHMVLAYYEKIGREPVVLDNLIKDIKKASERADLKPMYSFNSESLWEAKERGRGERMGSSEGIPRWDDLNERMAKELSGY